MKTLKEDFWSPLTEVERAWIRKPFTIIISFIAALCFAIVGMIEGIQWYYYNCLIEWWKGIK